MKHFKGYTNYQQNVIKRVAELVQDRPFTHEKAANNHLKILISGLDRPYFTSATPSDNRAFENIISDIKGAIRRAEAHAPASTVIRPDSLIQSEEKQRKETELSKVTKAIIKRIRHHISKIRQDEYDSFLASEECDCSQVTQSFRLELVKSEVDLALKNKRSTDYFTSGQLKNLRKEVMEHLDFMLPTVAEYHDLFKAKLSEIIPDPSEPDTNKDNTKIRVSQSTTSDSTDQNDGTIHPSATVSDETTPLEVTGVESQLQNLMKEKSHKRIATLKVLSKNQIAQLIDDCQKLLEQKHQEDIQAIVHQIQISGVSFDELKAAWAA